MRKTVLIVSLFLFLTGQSPKGGSIADAGTAPVDNPRYVSLAPSTTEILFALGLDQEIIGVSSFCDYPKKAGEKEKIGDFSNPNIEKILSLKPDHIFATGLEQSAAIDKLRKIGLKVYVSDPVNIRELLESIKEIGVITNRQVQAEELINGIRSRMERVSLKVNLVPKEKWPKVFMEIWHDPLTTAGNGSFVDEIITLAGGVNIAFDTSRPYSIFSQEEVIKRDPDYIIIGYMDRKSALDSVRNRFGWDKIKAIRNKNVYNDIDPALIFRPGPRFIDGLEEIHKRIFH
ncbi:MAG: cobalamin-binding protein [Candidatus Omnitrophota bacterium]|nr:cobalamin-binding protein [Candidatus Omnitrophota bacterium]MBU1929645.1 cobalamin-binding protein [Candidatus Omnitrophota bacterium]MBU2035399.1 cobalamin-binding protein [Candidatus Omnitrophota bacterium]MBU2221263.1 cobalamin-binding protein [Candidatus Omnitrophota bacterium]